MSLKMGYVTKKQTVYHMTESKPIKGDSNEKLDLAKRKIDRDLVGMGWDLDW